MKDPMSLRLGPLVEPIIEAAEAVSQTPSEWIRSACAAKLGVDPPEMPVGNPGAAGQSAAANAARWKKKKRRTRSS